jgi:hypothetical protein
MPQTKPWEDGISKMVPETNLSLLLSLSASFPTPRPQRGLISYPKDSANLYICKIQAGVMIEVIKHLPNKHKALKLNPSTSIYIYMCIYIYIYIYIYICTERERESFAYA